MLFANVTLKIAAIYSGHNMLSFIELTSGIQLSAVIDHRVEGPQWSMYYKNIAYDIEW